MAQKLDIEVLVGQVAAYMIANFNTKVAAINSEKADALSIKTVSDGAYFIQTLNENVANYDPYVFIGVMDPVGGESNGFESSQIVPINVALAIADSGTDPNLWRKLYRYQRALKEMFENDWNKSNSTRFKVRAYFLPIPVQYKVQQVGVELEATFA